MVEWDVEVISRWLVLLTWEVSAPALEKRPAEWKGFFRAAVPTQIAVRLFACSEAVGHACMADSLDNAGDGACSQPWPGRPRRLQTA